MREHSAKGGGGKVHRLLTAGPEAPQRPHPVPPSWHLARLECRPPRLPAPHRVSPLPRKPQGEARPPPLRPEPSGEWHAKSTVTRRTLCNSVAGPLRSSSGAGPSPCLPGSQSLEPCLLPVQHRNPEAIADGWTAPRLPGPGTYRREPPPFCLFIQNLIPSSTCISLDFFSVSRSMHRYLLLEYFSRSREVKCCALCLSSRPLHFQRFLDHLHIQIEKHFAFVLS